VRLRPCFARDKKKTRDNECNRSQLRHRKRIACWFPEGSR
jgi:hypothetical protein